MYFLSKVTIVNIFPFRSCDGECTSSQKLQWLTYFLSEVVMVEVLHFRSCDGGGNSFQKL
jgi:hypothetical protein